MEKNEFSRAFIRSTAKECGVELPKEMEDALVQRHIDSRNAYAEEQVKAYQDEHPAESAPDVKDSQEYKDLQEKYDNLVKDQAAKAAHAAKESAYRELLKAAGVSEKRIPAVLRVSDMDNVQLDKDGNIKDADKLTETIKTDWADFIVTTTETGAKTATPPANNGGSMTKAEIYKKDDKGRYVLSAAERQKAIAENPEEFGI